MSELFDEEKKSSEFITLGDDWWLNVANILFVRPIIDNTKKKIKIQFSGDQYITVGMQTYEEKVKPHLIKLLNRE